MSYKKQIKDVCSRFSSGKFISASNISESGLYPVYGANGLRGYTDTYNFDGECAVIGRQGAYCGNVKFFCGKGYMTEHAVVAVANDSNNTRFLSYKFALMNLGKYAGQSAQPGLSVETLLDVDIDVPPKAIQDKIARTLNLLDDKISNNNAICSTLESMAKLLYNYWFVQFNFPDKKGKPYKSSGGKMVWNEELKREIPEGWEVKKLSDIATLRTESVFPVDDTNYNHYSIPAFGENKIPSYENGGDIESNKYIVPKDSVLVSKLNPQFKRVWPIFNPPDNSICSTEFLPLVISDTGLSYLFEVLNTEEFSTHLRQKASSSTGSRKRITPDNVMSHQFAHNREISLEFNKRTEPLLKQRLILPFENQQLASFRDFLLPMLMNGQVTFKKGK